MDEWLVVDGETKRCQQCAENIKAEARVCRFCGARYDVEVQGYCANEHGLKSADIEGRCASCGGELVDRKVRSRFLGKKQVSAPAAAAPPAAALSRDAPRKRPSRRRIWLAFGLVLIFIGIPLVAVVTTIPGSRPSLGRLLATTPAPTATSTKTPTATAIPTPTRTPIPVGAAFGLEEVAAGVACFGPNGMTCLNQNGWASYNRSNSALRGDTITAIGSCPDGTLAIAHNRGVQLFDGSRFVKSLPSWGSEWIGRIACGEGGSLAAASTSKVGRLEANGWVTLDVSVLAPPDESDQMVQVKDLAWDNQGGLWIINEGISRQGSVGRHDGTEWTVFRESVDLPPDLGLQAIAIDGEGTVWVGHQDGLLAFDGEQWTNYEIDEWTDLQDLYIDTDNRVWFAHNVGFGWFQDGLWNLYEIGTNGETDDDPNAIWIDAGGRLWLATDYGLAIYDGDRWASYHMHTSGLASNDLEGVFVQAGGPNLPDLLVKEVGSISGRILRGSEPLNARTVEVCVIPLGMMYSGRTPCSKQPFMASTRTDAEGRYSFTVPPGHYYLAFTDEEGDWTRLTSGVLGMTSHQIVVEPGRETVVKDIVLQE